VPLFLAQFLDSQGQLTSSPFQLWFFSRCFKYFASPLIYDSYKAPPRHFSTSSFLCISSTLLRISVSFLFPHSRWALFAFSIQVPPSHPGFLAAAKSSRTSTVDPHLVCFFSSPNFYLIFGCFFFVDGILITPGSAF